MAIDWGKLFEKNLPTGLMAGLSLLGGDETDQPTDMRADYRGTGADGVRTMTNHIGAIENLMKGIQSRGPATLGNYDKAGQRLDLNNQPTGEVGKAQSPASSFPDIFGSLGRVAQSRAPLASSVNPTQATNEAELNQMNANLKGEQWYQDFFNQQGINPNKVKLSDTQREQLTQIAAMNGIKLGDRMKFDQAGNMNQKGGWAGMSPLMKTLLGGAAAVGTLGIAAPGAFGALGGLLGGGGGSAAAGGAGSAVANQALSGGSEFLVDQFANKTRRRNPRG